MYNVHTCMYVITLALWYVCMYLGPFLYWSLMWPVHGRWLVIWLPHSGKNFTEKSTCFNARFSRHGKLPIFMTYVRTHKNDRLMENKMSGVSEKPYFWGWHFCDTSCTMCFVCMTWRQGNQLEGRRGYEWYLQPCVIYVSYWHGIYTIEHCTTQCVWG